MAPELNFSGQNTLVGVHSIHAYAAKCPPQLVRYGLRYYSKRGHTVLDPMAGSGTTLVEAKLAGRHALGFDIDPLARLIAEVKCSDLCDRQIQRYHLKLTALLADAETNILLPLPRGVEQKPTPSGPRPADWFSDRVAQDLSRLVDCIEKLKAPTGIGKFFWVAFSSLILARSSVANARDVIHSRHHRFIHLHEPQVIERFHQRVNQMRRRMAEFAASRGSSLSPSQVQVCLGDARELPCDGRSVDLVFTSPPYATALDYTRAHFLAVAWMEPVLKVSLAQYLENGSNYIGSTRGRLGRGRMTPNPILLEHPACRRILEGLAQNSLRQAKLLERYFVDLAHILAETERVLRSRGNAVFVICPSHIRKIHVATDEVLIELARSVGLRLKGRHDRTIDCRRRLLPYMDGNRLGARMSKEYVLVFQKQ
jgi:tRNA G10  N-methylase Trm11